MNRVHGLMGGAEIEVLESQALSQSAFPSFAQPESSVSPKVFLLFKAQASLSGLCLGICRQ